MIHHFVNGIPENIIGCLENEQADHQACHRIQHREAQSGAANADEGAHGRKCIASVMPGVCPERTGIVMVGIGLGVPEHCLLADNGQHRRQQRRNTGYGQIFIISRKNAFRSVQTNEQAGDQQDHRQYDGRHTLKPLVSVGMMIVGCFGRHLYANDDNDAAEHIRSRMYRIADHGPGVGQNARQQFDEGQNHIPHNADQRHFCGYLFKIIRSPDMFISFSHNSYLRFVR